MVDQKNDGSRWLSEAQLSLRCELPATESLWFVEYIWVMVFCVFRFIEIRNASAEDSGRYGCCQFNEEQCSTTAVVVEVATNPGKVFVCDCLMTLQLSSCKREAVYSSCYMCHFQ